MSGSVLDAMARAVERAAVVLVCVSRDYPQSQACRTEAEYAYRLAKDIVPLMFEEAWLPDGWLGAMLGTKLWFNFASREREAGELVRLVAELGQRGRSHAPSGGAAATPAALLPGRAAAGGATGWESNRAGARFAAQSVARAALKWRAAAAQTSVPPAAPSGAAAAMAAAAAATAVDKEEGSPATDGA